VDDNRDAAETMGLLLDAMGFSPSTAYDGPSAVESIKTDMPDVVLLDIGLPGLSGIDVARRVRNEMAHPPALIAVTGYGQESDRETTFQAGFHAHLTKPVDVDQLTVLLERVLDTQKR
jgi:CheY-like chemotaxis protein